MYIEEKKCHIVLNDGTFLYNNYQVVDYLILKGFEPEELKDILAPEPKDNMECGDDWETIADGYYNAYQNLCNEIEAECEKFLSGRKITKANFVKWLKDIMEDALLNY